MSNKMTRSQEKMSKGIESFSSPNIAEINAFDE